MTMMINMTAFTPVPSLNYPHYHTRETVLEFLDCLLQGSVAGEIALYFNDIVTALVNPFVISPDSARYVTPAASLFL